MPVEKKRSNGNRFWFQFWTAIGILVFLVALTMMNVSDDGNRTSIFLLSLLLVVVIVSFVYSLIMEWLDRE